MVLMFLKSWGGGLDSYRGHTWDSLIGLHLHQLKLYLFLRREIRLNKSKAGGIVLRV